MAVFVVVGFGEVAEEEGPGVGGEGYAGGLRGGGMESLGGFGEVVVGIGCLVVQEGHVTYVVGEGGEVEGVGAVGVAEGWVGGEGQAVVGYDGAVGAGEVGSLLDRSALIGGMP